MSKKKSNHYLDDAVFYSEICKYLDSVNAAELAGEPKPRIPETIGQFILDLTNNLARRWNFANYTFKEEMISDAIQNIVECIGNFNPEKGKKPYSYFTFVAWRAFVRRIAQEEKVFYTQCQVYENVIHENEQINIKSVDPDYHKFMKQQMIEYEKKQERKREKKKKKRD